MFNFNLKKSPIYLAVKWAPVFKPFKVLKKIFSVLFIFSFLAFFFYGFLLERLSQESARFLLGFSIISLVLFLSCWLKQSFFDLKLKKPEIKTKLSKVIENPEQYNLANFLNFEVAEAVHKSKGLSSTHILYFLLTGNPNLNFIFSRTLLSLKETKKILKEFLEPIAFSAGKEKASKNFQEAILESLRIAQKKNHLRIETGDMITALAKCDPPFKRVLVEFKLKVEDIENLTWWLENLEEKIEQRKRFWKYENLAKKGTLAKEWASGYTITLDKYSTDWTEILRKNLPETIGHKKEIKMIERILSSRENNNVLLIGEPGTGRQRIIEALIKKSLLGKSLDEVNYKRVVELDMVSLLAGIEDIEEVEVILDKIFQEATTAGNVILVINEFHNYVGQVARPGIVDISGIIASYLQSPKFQIIAVTTYDGLHEHIEKNISLLSLFKKVEVSELSPRETLMILEDLTLILEKKYKKIISYPAIREIVSLTERYMPAFSFPGKAIEILDEVIIYVASSTKDKIVLPKHVAQIITEKTEIPVGEIKLKERELLLNLEKLIHQRIINQDEAVNEVSAAMRRARSEITIRKGSMGTFVFLGPTGVGKTETSKALAEIYFGSEEQMIRLDMSEFQDSKDISRLIGSREEIGLLTTPVRENPFSLILLDEIEKAHPNVLNLFLQVLDEGHLTDGRGRKVNFKNTIIIATSNAGYKIILKALKEKVEWTEVRQKLLDYIFANRIFRPEFVNRFDAVVVFSPLSKENLLDIAELMLEKLKNNLKEKGIKFVINKPLKEKIVELGYNPVFGARAMRRVIQDKVENVLASALLANELKRGDRVEVSKEFELIINS